MYRPNQLGPWPLVDVDTVALDYGTLGAAFQDARNVFDVALPDPTIRPLTVSRSWIAITPSLTARQQCSMGVAINGNNPSQLVGATSEDIGIQYQVSGFIRAVPVAGANNDARISCLVGRNNAATLQSGNANANSVLNYHYLPVEDTSNLGGQVSARINTSVIIGPWNGAVTVNNNPLLFFFTLMKDSGAAATYVIDAAMSVMKYTQDLHTVDPTRY